LKFVGTLNGFVSLTTCGVFLFSCAFVFVRDGAPPSMKRNMQEREIINGRMAMIAFAAFVFEEAVSHRALVSIPSNELLFEPAYQVPFIQEWLDQQFSN
jgi:Chlorophyll A-B binding protein